MADQNTTPAVGDGQEGITTENTETTETKFQTSLWSLCAPWCEIFMEPQRSGTRRPWFEGPNRMDVH